LSISELNNKPSAKSILNQSSTQLMHMVLKQVLGDHANKKGSLVEPERLRFDFSHSSPMTDAELLKVEQRVNDEIRANYQAKVEISSPEQAIASGAVALFGEKYGSKVRVVHFGPSV